VDGARQRLVDVRGIGVRIRRTRTRAGTLGKPDVERPRTVRVATDVALGLELVELCATLDGLDRPAIFATSRMLGG